MGRVYVNDTVPGSAAVGLMDEATELVRAARDAYGRRDWRAARYLLDRAGGLTVYARGRTNRQIADALTSPRAGGPGATSRSSGGVCASTV